MRRRQARGRKLTVSNIKNGKKSVIADGRIPGLKSLERDVSPGTMPDGSHAQTSGDRGESYEPSTLSKFKNKLGLGGKK
jgi:hypothetical protein